MASRTGRKKRFSAYQQRNCVLQKLGYESYADYLRSPLWAGIRQRVLERDQWMCCACGLKATQVHHRVYSKKNLTGKDLETLVSICKPCHEHIEFTPNGRKLSPSRANKRLNKKCRKRKQKTAVQQKPEAPPAEPKINWADLMHKRYRQKIADINRTLTGRKRVVALADARRERASEIGRYPKGVIASALTYPTGGTVMFSGKSESQRPNVVNVHSAATS